MTKKIVAKTNVSYGKKDGETVDFAPGDSIDASELGMTKTQLEQLYDAGAIELQESEEKREEDKEKQAEETGSQVTNEPVVGSNAPVKTESETSPTKSTPAKATEKSSGKSNPA